MKLLNQIDPIPGYQILEQLGTGSQGVVFKAFDLANGKFVAIKQIKTSPNERSFLQ
jgi:serine/threonine protein kinase